MNSWLLNTVYFSQFWMLQHGDIAIFPRYVKIPIVPLLAECEPKLSKTLIGFMNPTRSARKCLTLYKPGYLKIGLVEDCKESRVSRRSLTARKVVMSTF